MDPRIVTMRLYRNATLTRRGLIALLATLTLAFTGLLTVAVATARADDQANAIAAGEASMTNDGETAFGLDQAGDDLAAQQARAAIDIWDLISLTFIMSPGDWADASNWMYLANSYLTNGSLEFYITSAEYYYGVAQDAYTTGHLTMTGTAIGAYPWCMEYSQWLTASGVCVGANNNFSTAQANLDLCAARIAYGKECLDNLEAILDNY